MALGWANTQSFPIIFPGGGVVYGNGYGLNTQTEGYLRHSQTNTVKSRSFLYQKQTRNIFVS